jgi:hypothetical protein
MNNIFEDDFWPEGMLKMDGFDDCIIGYVTRCSQPPLLCYDVDLVIKKLMKDGMSGEEAEEYFAFNQEGAWVGEQTPCFLRKYHES